MTRRISLIIGIAVAALTVAVPTAFGEGRLAGSQEPDAVALLQGKRDGDHRPECRAWVAEGAQDSR